MSLVTYVSKWEEYRFEKCKFLFHDCEIVNTAYGKVMKSNALRVGAGKCIRV